MVKTFPPTFFDQTKDNIEADVIILGCSLPGIVTAHKLKKKFGDTMDIVVLDLDQDKNRVLSKGNVAFQEDTKVADDGQETDETDHAWATNTRDVRSEIVDNVARHYLAKYAKDFHIPLPETIVDPLKEKTSLNKLFQHTNGKTVECVNDYHDFDYLNFMEKFELTHYQTLLDQCMRDLFHSQTNDYADTRRLRYYDQTTMEKHICGALIFATSREIMRTTIKLVCGETAENVSVLFYLHQCFRTSSVKNHLDGCNTRFREKLLRYFQKHISLKLQQSVADITITVKLIKEIRTYSDEQVILETMKGETNYICNLLAMALRPDELHNIRVDAELLSEKEAAVAKAMIPGRARKFLIQYEENFWRRDGYSGDILSIKGPILWATERPNLSASETMKRYSALIGYLKVIDSDHNSREAVVEQLVKLFGAEAADPVNYKETSICGVFVPRCGDYVALRKLQGESSRLMEWGALDVFADGDIAAAIEAGNETYVHLLGYLRPQAVTFDDSCRYEWLTILDDKTFTNHLSSISILGTLRIVACAGVACVAWRLFSYMRRTR